uniref:DUF1963 domain-containing protein n=2 Tax=Flavobacterium sp. TaxID=239 RepID=UPI00404A5EAA
MKTKEEYLKQLNAIKWEKGKEIESFLIPAINIEIEEDQSEINLGDSKFGGKPDLPKNIEWPKSENEPMTFLAQLNLKQISEFDIDKALPNSGMLYFFIANPDEFSLDHKVIYSAESDLFEIPFPLDLKTDCQFQDLKMKFEIIYTFPSLETLELETLSENDVDSFYEIESDFFTYENNQILGHTYPMQSDVKREWACKYLRIKFSSETLNENETEIDYHRNEFINLFQFSTENSSPEFFENFSICSMGYFGIKVADLKEGNFDKTVLIFQNS